MEIPKNYLENLKKQSELSPHDHEFQEVCSQIEAELGKQYKGRIWKLPYQVGISEDKLRRALKEYQGRKMNYFEWILRNVIK